MHALTQASTPGAQTILLMLPSKKQIFPMSTVALTQAQASRHELETSYKDAYLLEADGSVRRIEQIQVLGLWGDSCLRKIVSRWSNAWRISVRLSDAIAWDIKRLRSLVVESLATGCIEGDEPGAANLTEVVAAVNGAAQADQVFAALNLPLPGDALDVL